MTQNESMEILKMGFNVFITGSAGSGKTHLLNKYVQFLRSKKVETGITASTGIAATHLDGITIDSWSGIGLKDVLTPDDLNAIMNKRYLRERFALTKVLVIDEVSMIHAHKLDMVDKILKSFKKNDLPFGGIQLVLCGDFFQLPPYSGGRNSSDFIYKSQIWNNMNLKICYLGQSFRQKDSKFLQILNSIRQNNVSPQILQFLMSKIDQEPELKITPTKLYTHNVDVDAINNCELEKIKDEEQSYEMYSLGNDALVGMLKKSCLAPEHLVLKRGALVMFVRNNFDKGYINGTMGKVTGFDRDRNPIVQIPSGRKITAEYAKWTIIENNLTRAEVSQIPLRLAWAITVHKSQGMSLDAVEIDLRKSFLPGMGYVALSRVRDIRGMKLLGFNTLALQVNPEVVEMDKNFREEAKKLSMEIKNMGLIKKFMMKRKFRYYLTS